MKSEALKRAQKRYQEKLKRTGSNPRKGYHLSLHTTHDADIIAFLEARKNINGYVKDLIRADMRKQG